MNRSRIKIVIASTILTSAMLFWIVAGVKSTSVRHFMPNDLIEEAGEVDGSVIQLEGHIANGSSHWNAEKLELTFAIHELEGEPKIDVISVGKLQPDNFRDGGQVFVEGRYNAEKNLIVASKVQTKCASKYEGTTDVH